MLRSFQILVSTSVLGICAVSLSACGQQGPLYLSTEPAAAKLATLPKTQLTQSPTNTAQPDSISRDTASPVSAPTASPQ
ncbi:MAG: lipoprotein [Comamonadaceae bacterium]